MPNVEPPESSGSPWRAGLRTLAHDRSATAGLLVLVVLAVIAIAARHVAPYPPNAQPDIVGLKNAAPSLAHPFGTDQYSRDVLSRIIFGARVSLSVVPKGQTQLAAPYEGLAVVA